ncbi:MAG: zinc-ribbon domain-containing transport protein [Clostridia bacterium]|nr:zinc-ribbon domain-containing transport protein [Clostridia bacterium]
MKRVFLVLLSVLLIAAFVLTPRVGHADLGDFSSGGDYGGGGSDWGGGGDWGGSSGWGLYGGDYPSSRSGGSCGAFEFTLVLIIVVILLIVSYYSAKNKAKKTVRNAPVPGATRTAASLLHPISELIARDPDFSPEDLKEWLQNLYIKMQDCCTKRDVEPIRPYFSDALWQQFDRQVKQLRSNHRTNYVERISVLSVDIKGCYQDKGEDVIVAEIYARITDYTLNDDTGTVVAGSRDREKFMTYEYSLSRPIGMKTEPRAEGVTERHCPNCGAPLSVNESIKCPYCDSVLTFSDHDWTVYAIKGISQRTV